MIWLAVVLAAAGLSPNEALPVRLAPVICPGFPDPAVRAALRVEIRDRLISEAAPAPADFTLVSVACAGQDAELLVVRQGTGVPVRRRVPLVAVVPDARPRAVALAIAELLRVDLARNEPPPPPSPPPPPPSAFMMALSGTPFVLGGYLSGEKKYWFQGLQLRLAFESATQPSPGRAWAWGLALAADSNGLAGPDRYSFVGSVAALLRHEQSRFAWELDVGARIGRTWDQSVGATPQVANLYGPFASLALDSSQGWQHGFSRFALETGSDSGPLGGRWVRLVVAGGFRW